MTLLPTRPFAIVLPCLLLSLLTCAPERPTPISTESTSSTNPATGIPLGVLKTAEVERSEGKPRRTHRLSTEEELWIYEAHLDETTSEEDRPPLEVRTLQFQNGILNAELRPPRTLLPATPPATSEVPAESAQTESPNLNILEETQIQSWRNRYRAEQMLEVAPPSSHENAHHELRFPKLGLTLLYHPGSGRVQKVVRYAK